MDDAPLASYQPFPSFVDWAAAKMQLDYVDEVAVALDQAKQQHDVERLAAAVREMSRAAAVDTSAIEGLFTTDRGFTRTVATEAATWQAAAEQRGSQVVALIEDAIEAYDYVLDAATTLEPVSETWIRQLHVVHCRHQATYPVHTAVGMQEQPLPKGVYKDLPNNPTSVTTGRVHHYAPPTDVPAEMGRFVAELRSAEFAQAHAVVQAAYAHYAFVCIHPFADGNGRVARALTSAFTYRRPGVPLVVYADQREEYIDTLEAADAGDYVPFIDYVGQRVADVVELVRLRATAPIAPPVAQSLDRLRAANTGPGGLPHTVVDGLAARLTALTAQEVRRQFAELSVPEGADLQMMDVNGVPPRVDGYRPIPQGWQAQFGQGHPASVAFTWRASTHVALPGAQSADFMVSVGEHRLEVRRRDIHPQETHLLRMKVESFVSGLLAQAMAELGDRSEQALRAQGYLP